MTLIAEPITRPQGKARKWTDDEIALLALLLLADVDDALLIWTSLAPRAYRDLLTAQAFPDVRQEDKATLPPLWFDVHSQRYGLADRGFIRQAAIIAAVDDFRDTASEQASTAVAAVYAGTVDVEVWQAETAQTLRSVALATVAAGVGGTGRLSGDDLNASSNGLTFHLERLQRFAEDIAGGRLTAEAAQRRAALYPESIVVGNYDVTRQRSHDVAGFTLERNILDPDADHCRRTVTTPPGVPDCPELTRAGWLPIGSMPAPGLRICKWNCRCHFDFRRESPEDN